MTRAELEARLDELQPYVEEYEALRLQELVAYHIAEGFIEEEDGCLYIVGEPCEFPPMP